MRKKIVLALVLALTFGLASLSFAVDPGPPPTEAPAPSVLPSLTGEETERFNAASLSDAQKICDQVATANNRSKCAAKAIEVSGTTQAQPSVFYCDCSVK